MLATAGAMLAVAAPTAGAATETVTNGPVTATFSYAKTDELTFEDLHLKIVRAGVVGLDVRSPRGPANSAAGPAPNSSRTAGRSR